MLRNSVLYIVLGFFPFFSGICQTVFQDITLSSNLLDTTSISRSASCADIDDDGLLDLFINNAHSKNQMYFNSFQGYFNLQSEQFGIDYLPFEDTYSSTWIDIENDGDSGSIRGESILSLHALFAGGPGIFS